jgi:hypothetical protein
LVTAIQEPRGGLAQILGFGADLPLATLSNAALAAEFGIEEGWIRQVCGIEERRMAGPCQSVVDLAEGAARACLANAQLEPEALGGILVGTGRCSWLGRNTFWRGHELGFGAPVGPVSRAGIYLPIATREPPEGATTRVLVGRTNHPSGLPLSIEIRRPLRMPVVLEAPAQQPGRNPTD